MTAVFLSAMALGLRSIGLLLVALLLLVVAGLAVFLLGLWYAGKRVLPGGTAYVITASPPPVGSIVGRCDMRLLLDLPGGGTKMIKLRDPSVSVTKWPRPGTILELEADRRSPRNLRVRWERVGAVAPRPPEEVMAAVATFHTEFTDDTRGAVDPYAGPTPAGPEPRIVNAVQPASYDRLYVDPDGGDAYLDDPYAGPTPPGPDLTPVDAFEAPGPPRPYTLIDPPIAADLGPVPAVDVTHVADGLGPIDGAGLAPVEVPEPSAAPESDEAWLAGLDLGPRPADEPTAPNVDAELLQTDAELFESDLEPLVIDPEPAADEPSDAADLTDLTDVGDLEIIDLDSLDSLDLEPPREPDLGGDERARAAQYELPVRGIPQPRPAEPVSSPRPEALADDFGPAVVPEPAADHGVSRPGMGIMLLVSDLTRSLDFYRDILGFEVADRTAGGAVLTYGGGRLLLRHQADMSPVDRRVVHLHIEVPDVDAAYRDLLAKGVEFVHKPRVLSRGDKLELWAARFRDPDGHGIALTQWRDREEAPRQT